MFEEANALSSTYLENNKQGKTLKNIVGSAYKILLTGTPIEKNIMDLYGLMYFIDETVLPDEKTFLTRYLRKPENYPELAKIVSNYCFRTLRQQAKQYSKVPNRINATIEFELSKEEKNLYNLLFCYVNKEQKIAFPEMNTYDLALRLLGALSSSTMAMKQMVQGVIKRIENIPQATDELNELEEIVQAAELVTIDTKGKLLIESIGKMFPILKKCKANRKAVIFTESVATQKYLNELLGDKYKTNLYNGTTDYMEIENFKKEGEILISTDSGARGFNLEESSFVVNYDFVVQYFKNGAKNRPLSPSKPTERYNSVGICKQR